VLDLKTLSKDDWILLSDQAKAFMESKLWQYIEAMVYEEQRVGMYKLANIDPDDAKKIRDIQSDIAVAERVPQWFISLINEGEQLIQEKIIEEAEGE